MQNQQPSETIYHVAMYLRLSRDDGDGNVKSESNSIGSQRAIIRSFISEKNDMQLYDVYVDDGFTGSSFNRPDFKRMITDIEAGNVNCVIVKDLSRFGRDYIEAGRFIQKLFPRLGVRFIAITDHFDSATAETSESAIVLPVKNFINDAYCRDISAKVRSQKKMKQANGEFIGAFAPYGYRKDSGNRNKLVVDEYAAHVIKNIYDWKLNGISAAAIAKKLNQLGILSPFAYKRSQGEHYKTGFTGKAQTDWQSVTIKRILTNELYLGHMIQGKKEKVNYKIKKSIEKPESEWARVENTHDPIIEVDIFNIAQNLLKVDGRATADSENGNFFTGLLFCAHCKEQLVRRTVRNKGTDGIAYICSTYNRGEGCTRHFISEAELKVVVFKECCTYANLFLSQADLLEEIKQKETNFEVITKYDQEITRLRTEQERYYKLSSGLYEDLRNGVLNKDEFEQLHHAYTENADRLDQAIKNQEELVKRLFKQGIAAGTRLEKFKSCLQLEAIDRYTLVNLIHRIAYYGDKRIAIEFNFQAELTVVDTVVTAVGQSTENATAGQLSGKIASDQLNADTLPNPLNVDAERREKYA
ncbi:MAG: recombinase family protein [Lachnospiraceae bacterium]|jgi:DNA invertase Pin-like site-specific DNA recombinase|nr:recombinase family protein [Lachnospiraceae bacterium]